MVSFRKLTILQLGGEERLLKMDNVEVGCWPVSLMFRSHNVLVYKYKWMYIVQHYSALENFCMFRSNWVHCPSVALLPFPAPDFPSTKEPSSWLLS